MPHPHHPSNFNAPDPRPSPKPDFSPPEPAQSADTVPETQTPAVAPIADVSPSEVAARLRKVIIRLIPQLSSPGSMDQMLTNLSPTMAVADRMPFTVRPQIMSASRLLLIHNMVGHTILIYGVFARGEAEWAGEDVLLVLEDIAAAGLARFVPAPVTPKSAVYTLRRDDIMPSNFLGRLVEAGD